MSVFIAEQDGQYYCKCYDEIHRLQEEIMAGVQTLTAKMDDPDPLVEPMGVKWQEVVKAGWVQVGCSRVVLARRAGVDEMALPWNFEAPVETKKKATKRGRGGAGGLSAAQKRKPVAGSSKRQKPEPAINIPDSDDEEEYTPPSLENFIPTRELIVPDDESTRMHIGIIGPLSPKTTTAADGPGETYYSQTQRSELTNNDDDLT
jgi:hypothetical protein